MSSTTPDVHGAAWGWSWNASLTFTTPCQFQYFTVPAGVTNATVFLWGSGAGGDACGAYVEGALYVTAGEQLRIIVGGTLGGEVCGYGGGAAGGFSAISRLSLATASWDYLAVAGGAGYCENQPSCSFAGAAAGRAIPSTCGAFNPQ